MKNLTRLLAQEKMLLLQDSCCEYLQQDAFTFPARFPSQFTLAYHLGCPNWKLKKQGFLRANIKILIQVPLKNPVYTSIPKDSKI
ncbi:unnamed protein product [Allacma fusca]|uniref:Uncharacterized protein n=1 Tax=Allacma fusca TaxID=39272 RepID=A0A8J2P5D0_9HEXA|nr:unnamed protein product [Allacma fusca]